MRPRIEIRLHKTRPGLKKLKSFGVAQRAEGPAHLARNAQRFAARRQDRQLGAILEQPAADRRALGRDVLAVVEDEEHALAGQPRGDHAQGRALARKLEHRHEQAGHVVGADQLDPPRAVRPRVLAALRHLHGQTALAHAAGTHEGHHAGGVEQRLQRTQLRVAVDEGGQEMGQPARHQDAGSGPQR